jgi:hypothetical protein
MAPTTWDASLVTKIHLHMAQEGSAVDDYVDDRSEATMRRFREADSSKKEAYQRLEPLVATLGEVPRRRLAELLELEKQWHAAVETELFAPRTSPAQRHGPVQEATYDSMLVAAANPGRRDRGIREERAQRDRRE